VIFITLMVICCWYLGDFDGFARAYIFMAWDYFGGGFWLGDYAC
jgi:hypothetical protein